MISKIEKIKNSIDTFNDAEFFTFGEEKNQVIIKNTNDNSLWAINYIEAEETIIFDTEKAEKIQEGEPSAKEQYQESVNGLMTSLKGIFEDDSEKALESIKGYIKTLPHAVPTFESEEQEPEEKFEGTHLTALAENVNAFYQAKKDFGQLGYLFESSEIKKGKIFDPLLLVNVLDSKNKSRESFIENVQLIVSFKEKLATIFENEDIASFISAKMDLKNPKVSIPKALVLVKKKFEEDFNIVDLQKEVFAAYNEVFEGSNIQSFMEGGGSNSMEVPAPFIYNQVPAMPAFRFLKFRTGAFNEDSLNTLQKELQSVMGRYSELNSDELKMINEMTTKVNYMQMTGQIDDQLVVSIIEEFNKAFKKKDDYKNASLQLGFKSAGEMAARNFNKGTSNVPTKK